MIDRGRAMFSALVARCELLGLEALPLAWLGIDVLLLLALAGGVVGRLERASHEERWGSVRTLLASGLVLLGTVVLSATLLGAAGQLGPRELLATHAALLALFALAERSRGERAGAGAVGRWALRPLAAAAASVRTLCSAEAWRAARRSESIVLLALLVALAYYFVLATFTPPFNWDANTYRLSRVAHWLQEGSIHHFPTNDERQNWVGQNADLVMLWLTGFFRREYPLVNLAQYGGGLLACLAVGQLAGWLGMTRRWRLGAALILVGTPTVGTQFFTAQTDLFTAGCLAAGLAFLPAALRGPKRAEWILVGIGFGLALGAKATVLYWAPGLGALLALWSWSERAALRAVLRGGLVAAAVALPLSGFNFLLNSFEFGQPLGSRRALRNAAQWTPASSESSFSTNSLALVWQLFEPHSNPLLPAAVHEPMFEELLERLATRNTVYRALREALPRQGGWRARGLNEDEASLGLLVVLLAAAGGALALAGALRERSSERSRTAAIVVVSVAGLTIFAGLVQMTVHQYRYLCTLGPFTALLAADLFARRRGRCGRALGALFLAGQFATAVYVGCASRNQGLRVLRDPAAATWSAYWSESRRLAERLGPTPLAAGVALYQDSWLAPLYRSGVAHRWRAIEGPELGDRPSVSDLLARHGLEAVVADARMFLRRDLGSLSYQSVPSALGWQRAILRPLASGRPPLPWVIATEGVHSDLWTSAVARFWLSGWRSARFALAVRNPTPYSRAVEIASSRGVERVSLAPSARAALSIEVRPLDAVSLSVDPPYRPAEHGHETDRRALGVTLVPSTSRIVRGVSKDGWSMTTAKFRLRNWYRGSCWLELSNPTPLMRTVRVHSSIDEATVELAPGASGVVALGVEATDEVGIDVAPPFVPRDWGRGDDARELGVRIVSGPRADYPGP